MLKKLAYKIVLKDMEKNPVFRGVLKLDPHYNRGIATAIEHIAKNAGKQCYYDTINEKLIIVGRENKK